MRSGITYRGMSKRVSETSSVPAPTSILEPGTEETSILIMEPKLNQLFSLEDAPL